MENIDSDLALAALRAKLTGRTIATAIFTRLDGKRFTLTDVNVDSIGPSAENSGVVGVEFMDDTMRIVHLPFIQSWEIEYA